MALLRDKVTSSPIFDGTPLEVVLLAEKIGRDEVLFDDVGQGFDPDAVLQAHQESMKAHQSVARSSKSSEEDKKIAQDALDNAPSVESDVHTVEAALAEARARVED